MKNEGGNIYIVRHTEYLGKNSLWPTIIQVSLSNKKIAYSRLDTLKQSANTRFCEVVLSISKSHCWPRKPLNPSRKDLSIRKDGIGKWTYK